MKKFTLLELLIVVSIIAILLSLLLPSLKNARKTAMRTVCLSNLSQHQVASSLYINDNSGKFALPQIGNANNCYRYSGKRGTYTALNLNLADVKDKPLNAYLGFKENGQEVEIAMCPLDTNKTQRLDSTIYDFIGSSYMFSARGAFDNDLDGNEYNAQYLSKINHPSKMILVTSFGSFHYSKFPNWFSSDMELHFDMKNRHPFAFVDGSSRHYTLNVGEGWDHSFNNIDWTNQQ